MIHDSINLFFLYFHTIDYLENHYFFRSFKGLAIQEFDDDDIYDKEYQKDAKDVGYNAYPKE